MQTAKSALALIGLHLAVSGGCAGEQRATEHATAPGPAASAQPAGTAESPADASAEPDDAGAKAHTTYDAARDPAAEGREIQYVVTSDGLEVRVEGVRFITNASAVRVGSGFGVELTVSATSKDDEPHSLLSPKNGPLALAGSIDRAGQRERFGDEREGNAEKRIEPGRVLKFTRRWPAKNSPVPVRTGETLELDVGLWGLGKSAEERKPVKNFFHVKLAVGDGKPQAVVSPPDSAERQ
jgi:hypothetical protein